MNSRISRRRLLGAGLSVAALPLMSACGSALETLTTSNADANLINLPSTSPASLGFAMPDEGKPHLRTWMAWPAKRSIWGQYLEYVRDDTVRLAQTIRRFEPVTVVARSDQVADAKRRLGANINVLAFAIDDAWIRDTGPTFLTNGKGGKAGTIFNFNGWGNKQAYSNDALLAERMLTYLNLNGFRSPIVTEGGAIEVDGDGTILTSESALLNANRNPGKTKAQVEAGLMGWLGAKKVIWIPGGNDYYTNGHVDGYARFIRPGVVVCEITDDPSWGDYDYTVSNLKALQSATDAKGRKLEVVTVMRPRKDQTRAGSSPDFAPDYVNYYLCNNAIILPEFGDKPRDDAARDLFARLYPTRTVVQLNIDEIAAGGGGIHCFTQQEPVA